MRISVNLASRPFVELRPFFARLRWIMGGLAVVVVGLAIATHMMQKKLDVAQGQMDALIAKTETARQEKMHNEAKMRLPANAAVLERSRFLNTLFLRKSFSWTAVMMDLETVLPSGVQITSIEPSVTAEGPVVIRLRVSGDRDRAVLLVRNLERSKRFHSPRLNGEASQAKATNGAPVAPGVTPGVEFEILADYNPITTVEAEAANPKKDAAVKGSAKVERKPKSTPKTAEPKPGVGKPKSLKPSPVKPGPGVTLKPFVKPGAAARPATTKPKGGAQ